MFHEYLQGSLEALLFAAGEPLTVAQIAGIMQLDKPQVWELLTTPALCPFKTAGARAGSKIIGSGNGNFGHCCV